MLSDDDLEKWEYAEHTAAKHRLLERYVKAWLAILGQAARRGGHESRLVLVDGFAGRGRYREDEPGSPLILRDIAQLVSEDGRVGTVELHFIERNRQNYEALRSELGALAPLPQVIQPQPVCAPFEQAAPSIIANIGRERLSSFWFIDPFGFGGVPLHTIREILSLERSEVFISLMVRDMWRFRNVVNHRQAIARLLGLEVAELEPLLVDAERSGRGAQVFCDLYVNRLKTAGGARYTWLYSLAARGAKDIVYYLVHGSTDPKALREMKKASYAVSGGTHGFLGATDDPASTGQIDMFGGDPVAILDMGTLRRRLLEVFAGRTVEYEALQDEAHDQSAFDLFIDRHIHQELQNLVREGRITKIRLQGKHGGGLERGDQLRFPPM
ncbi:MAG TPA: three-Cys-motif partner protein TcmP [Chloroflexota bacterium]|nr:three-Cys-motif partner protein TcmP [Chloroflexota bacterium]